MSNRPCLCSEIPPGSPFNGNQCYLCWLYSNNPKYKAYWDSDGHAQNIHPVPIVASKWARRPCKFLGEKTGRTVKCKTCTKTIDVPLVSCSIFGFCTERVLAHGHQCCSICDKREDSGE